MKITLLCIGQLKSGPENQIIKEYIKRLNPWEVDIIEGYHGPCQQESLWLIRRLRQSAFKVLLCEHGQQFSSIQLANLISQKQSSRFSEFQIIIGGAAGFDKSIYHQVDLTLSLSLLTWPHLMVRIMIVEQLYRIKMILDNRPYHK